MNKQQTAYWNFTHAVGRAAKTRFVRERDIANMIARTMDGLMQDVRAEDLRADNSDAAHRLESAIYAYVKESNPELASMFAVIEGYGERSHAYDCACAVCAP